MHMERAEHLKRTGHMESGVGTENREEMEKESRTVNGNVKGGKSASPEGAAASFPMRNRGLAKRRAAFPVRGGQGNVLR